MNTRIAKKLVSELPLNINDIARLILEITEALGKRAAGLTRLELLALLRRVMAEGVHAVEKAEQTVSFAIWQPSNSKWATPPRGSSTAAMFRPFRTTQQDAFGIGDKK